MRRGAIGDLGQHLVGHVRKQQCRDLLHHFGRHDQLGNNMALSRAGVARCGRIKHQPATTRAQALNAR
jgi:hypothetical protein